MTSAICQELAVQKSLTYQDPNAQLAISKQQDENGCFATPPPGCGVIGWSMIGGIAGAAAGRLYAKQGKESQTAMLYGFAGLAAGLLVEHMLCKG